MARTGRNTIANHPAKSEIEFALARRVPFEEIGRRYGVTRHALRRYLVRLRREDPEGFHGLELAHWSAADEKELQQLRDDTARGVLIRARMMYESLNTAMQDALAAGQLGHAANLAGRAQAALHLLARLSDQLQDATKLTVNNFLISPEFWKFKRLVAEILANHADLRARYVDGLRRIEADTLAAQEKAAPMVIDQKPAEPEHASQ